MSLLHWCICHPTNQFLLRTFDAIDEKILECEAASAVQAELLEGRGGGAKTADDASAPTAAAAASPVATSAAAKTAGAVGGAAAAVAKGAGGAAKKGQEQQQAKAGERVMVVGGALTLRLGEALARVLAMLEEGEGGRGRAPAAFPYRGYSCCRARAPSASCCSLAVLLLLRGDLSGT